MTAGVDGSARVIWVDDDDGGGTVVGEGFDFSKVNFPSFDRRQVVVPWLDGVDRASGLVRRKPGPWEENIAATCRQGRQADLQRLCSATRDSDVIEIRQPSPASRRHSLREVLRHRPVKLRREKFHVVVVWIV